MENEFKKNKERRRLQAKREQNQQTLNYRTINYEEIQSLKVVNVKGKKKYIETDKKFIKSIDAIYKSTENMLREIIGIKDNLLTHQQYEEIHHKGKTHHKASMINLNSNLTSSVLTQKPELEKLYCQCGCQRFKGKTYQICHDIQQLDFLGSGILLFFFLLKGLFINIILVLAIYAIYPLIMNFQGTLYQTHNPSTDCLSSYCLFKDRTSSYNQTDSDSIMNITQWLGLGSMIMWCLVSRFLKHYAFYKDKLIDQNLQSSGDYTIKINNLCDGDYNQNELFEFLEQLYDRKIAQDRVNKNLERVSYQAMRQRFQPEVSPTVEDDGKKGLFGEDKIAEEAMKGIGVKVEQLNQRYEKNHFHIKSIQIIYKMQFSRKIIKNIIDKCVEIYALMKIKEGQFYIKQKDKYLQLKKDIIQTYQLQEDLRKKFLTNSQFRKKISTRTTIIQFKANNDKQLILDTFGKKKLTPLKRIRERIIECFGGQSSIFFKGKIPIFEKAPQPSDIIWENCQKEFSYGRLFGILLACTIVILISLGIIAGLQALQFYFTNQQQQTSFDSQLTRFFNFLTSIALVVINNVLWILLDFLLDYEYNHTKTDKIISQMQKSSFAMWINIIIIPIVVNYGIYDKYFGSEGVAGIAFDYQVTGLAISLPLLIFNPLQIIVRIALKIRCIRNYLIRARYHKRSEDNNIDEALMQKIYKLYQAPQFVIEKAYIYILPNILHALFFCDLQPFLIVLACFQVFLFYWACKIRVLKICRVPALIDRLVFQSAHYQMMFAPIFYGVGSIFNRYMSHKLNKTTQLNLVAPLICVGLGVINYINPGNLFQNFISGMVSCFPCLRNQAIFLKKDLSKSKKEQVKETSFRMENYYKSSNTLPLLGFQRSLLGEQTLKLAHEELKIFCESHVKEKIQASKIQELLVQNTLRQPQDSYLPLQNLYQSTPSTIMQ